MTSIQAEQSPIDAILATPVPMTKEEQNNETERTAFLRYVQDNGASIPSNFKTADDWFNSLLSARSELTRKQQEVAELKKKFQAEGTTNPNYVPPPEAPKNDLSGVQEVLSIQAPPEVKEPPKTAVGPAEWAKWGDEIDRTGGVSDETRAEIQSRMGTDPMIIDQMIAGRKALAKQSWDTAASAVGGSDNLKVLFKWAGENLTKDELDATNSALRTNAAKNVLLGLQARMNSNRPGINEPKPTPNTVNAGSSGTAMIRAFDSWYEQRAAIADPRYEKDPNYRGVVDRMQQETARKGFRIK